MGKADLSKNCKMNKKIELALNFTFENYEHMEKDVNKEAIANFVFNRLSVRYLQVLRISFSGA
jgi:hypothetical protein